MRLQPSNPSGQTTFGFYQDSWTLILFVAVSVALHLLLVLIVVLMPKIRPSRRFDLPASVQVRMVSLPGGGQKTPAKAASLPPTKKKTELKPDVKEITPPKPKPKPKKAIPIPKKKVEASKPAPEPKKAISIAPKKVKKKKYKPKPSLKRKTYKPKKTIKETIDRLEKKVKDSDAQRVKKALDRIRKQVKQTGPVDRLKKKMATQGSGAVGGGGLGGGRRAIEMMDIYRAEIPYRIQENWAFPSQLAGEARHLKTVIVIKIMPNGEIADIWFEQRSGNQYLDESAYKAIQKSSPLPPLPPGYRRPFYNLGIGFTPEGVE
jgi:colicin import membrane protein